MAMGLEGGADMIILSDMGGKFSQPLAEVGICSKKKDLCQMTFLKCNLICSGISTIFLKYAVCAIEV